MNVIPTSGNQILVDTPETAQHYGHDQDYDPAGSLISWLSTKADNWRDHRDRANSKRWRQYWRMWRGQWVEEDKSRLSERSRLIAPALSQAIEATAAEIEEGALSKDNWVDITDDVDDAEEADALLTRDQFLEDLEEANAKDALAEVVFNGCLFGTGIVKLHPYKDCSDKLSRDPITGALTPSSDKIVRVGFESVRPDEFIPDPAGKNIPEMLGVFHEIRAVPVHKVLERIQSGLYRRDALPHVTPVGVDNRAEQIDGHEADVMLTATETDSMTLLEYHGKVPLDMLWDVLPNTNVIDDIINSLGDRKAASGTEYVEAIVTIGNGGVLLRAQPTPFIMKDRSFVAYQHDKVPGRFWGRGVAEKGFNPQKALDSEIRSRIDSLGFISSPMLAVDAGSMPKGFKAEIRPGKIWKTNGPPNASLMPLQVGALNASTFNQTGEMERMVQMGTGAFDTAGSLSSQSQSGASGASSNSMMMGAFVKRSRRSIKNFSNNLLSPALKKALWRYMQFAPERYPTDFSFKLVSGSGLVAQEVEAMQLTQLLGMMPQGFESVGAVVAKGIIANSAVDNKAEISAAIDQALQPPSEEEQQKQKELQDAQYMALVAEAQGKLLENQKTIAEIRETLAKADVNARRADVEETKVQQEQQRIALQAQEIDQFQQQNQIAFQRLKLQEKTLEMKSKQTSQE